MHSSRYVQALRYVVHVGLGVAILAYIAVSVVDAQLRSAAVMQEAATAFVNSLNAEQKTRATMDVADKRRIEWHYVPRERKGLAVRDMTEAQKRLALALVDTIGPIGSKKVRAIMLLDNLLRQLEPEKIKLEGKKGEIYEIERGDGYYSFVVYGTPTPKGTWGWSAEGHHVSVNITVVDGEISSTPFFLGSDPAEVKDGPQKGLPSSRPRKTRRARSSSRSTTASARSPSSARPRTATSSPSTRGRRIRCTCRRWGSGRWVCP